MSRIFAWEKTFWACRDIIGVTQAKQQVDTQLHRELTSPPVNQPIINCNLITHTPTHICQPSHPPHTRTHTHTQHARANTHTHTTRTHTHTQTHTNTYTHRTHKHTRTNTQAHTHTLHTHSNRAQRTQKLKSPLLWTASVKGSIFQAWRSRL